MEQEPEKTTTVQLSGPNNSMTFTTCCGLAVIKEKQSCCPGCKARIIWIL